MKVADSSFVVEGLLKRKELLEEDTLVIVDLALYEVANSIWKHQYLLKDLEDGLPYLNIFYGLVDSGRIQLVHAGKELMEKAYSLAAKNRRPVYDMVFVALAQELESELATFDERQAKLARRD